MKLKGIPMPLRKGWSQRLRLTLISSCFFLFGGIGHISAQSAGSPITLSVKDKTMKSVLQEIQKKTAYEFFYSNTEVNLGKHITVNLQQATLEETLKAVLGKSYNWRVEGKYIYITVPASPKRNGIPLAPAQQRPNTEGHINGSVTTTSGQLLAGVTIRVKGTGVGIVSDERGSFHLDVDGGQRLEFSFIGYNHAEVKTDTVGAYLMVVMNETPRSLNQVVVTGYSNKRMGELTGAISTVTADELQNTTTQSVFDNLQGKVAGMNVSIGGGNTGSNSNASIVIRGKGSMGSGATQPLIVIDGIIQDYSSSQDPLSNISPTDVQSVTVLKDAASAAIYGSRAANGVLVITTKRGAPGKTKVGANATYGMNKSSLGKFRMMDSQERYDLQQQIYHNQYLDANPGATDADINNYVATMVPDSVLKHNTNWPEEILRTGQTQDYNVWVSGGEDRLKYYASGDYFNEQSPLITDSYKKYNFRFNVDFQATKRLSITSNASISSLKQVFAGFYRPFSTSFNIMPWDTPYNPDGSMKVGGVDEPGWNSGTYFNPLYGKDYDDGISKSTVSAFDLNLKYKLTDWLSFSTRNRYTGINSETQYYLDPRDKTGDYYSIGGLFLTTPNNSTNIITTEMLQVDKSFGRNHISGLVAFEYNKVTSKGLSASIFGLKPGIRSLSAGDQSTLSVQDNLTEVAYLSTFSELNYSYDEKYFVTASFRRDGSSKFGANNKYGNFYAFSGAWQLNKERFLSSVKGIDLLKLRFSYGVSGNDLPLGAYQYLSLYSYLTGFDLYDRQTSTAQTTQGNNNLHWEMQYTTNIGIDAGFWDRVNVSVELYNKLNKGLLLQITPPATSGGNIYYDNVGKIRNKGLEVTVNTRQLKNTAVRWSTDFTFAYNDNKVLALQPGANVLYNGQYSGSAYVVGSGMNSYYMPVYAGVDPTTGESRFEVREKDANGNYTGKVDYTNTPGNATLAVLGNSNPKYVAGMTNNLFYKNFNLSVMLSYFGGFKMLNRTRADLDLDGSDVTSNNAAPAAGQIRWQHPGEIADLPKAGTKVDAYFPTSRYVENGEFLRLKNIRLSYTLEDRIVKRMGVSKLSLFVSGDNLATSTKFSGMDPENTITEENEGKVPFTKRFLGGVQVTF